MLKKFISTGAVMLFFSAASLCFAGKAGPAKMLSRLPPAVRQTIRAQLAGGRLSSIEKDQDNGELTYDVTIRRAGQTRDFTVGAQGQLLDQQVFLPELPPAVQAAILSQASQTTPGDIYQSTDDGEISYDVELTSGGQPRNFTFAADGRLLDFEVFLAELPPKVQQTIQKQLAGATPGEMDKSFEDPDACYDVQLTRAGQTRDFTVSLAGELLDQQVFLNELPATLQTAIQKAAGQAKITDIYQSTDDDGASYDVDLPNGRTLTFDADGSISSDEQPVNLSDAPAAVQKTLRSLSAHARILDLSQDTEDGTISYDVDLYPGGREKTISLDADGKILPDDD